MEETEEYRETKKAFLEAIRNMGETPEMKKFNMKSIGDNLTLYQDFNKIDFQLLLSHSQQDEHNWVFAFYFLFWGFEITWNGRRKNKMDICSDKSHWTFSIIIGIALATILFTFLN